MENFNKVYAENHKSILGYINSKIHDFELAQEMANDVFIKLSTRLHTFDETKASLKTWVTTFAKNAVIDHYRRKKIQLMSIDNSNDHNDEKSLTLADTLKDKTLTPYDQLKNKELKDNIEEVIYNLKKRNFDVAYYFFIEQLSYEEIADVLNLSLGTIKGQLFRARKEMQKSLVLSN